MSATFKVEGDRSNDTKDIILSFLSSVDGSQLSAEVLSGMGWGTGGDPVETAIEILKQRVSEW